MVDPASDARIELLTARIWKLEEALMSLVCRDGFEYSPAIGEGHSVVNAKCSQELLDSLPWLAGPEMMGN